MSDRSSRIETANAILRLIASRGRRFFSQDADCCERMESPRISRFEMRGKWLWYIDKYKGTPIFAHYDPRCRSGWGWRFSEGGTLLSLCRMLRDYIISAEPIKLWHFGPWPEHLCDGDLWGYGKEEMALLRSEIEAVLKTAEWKIK